LERAATGAAAPPGLDAARYRLDPPPPSADPATWRAALDNARAQLEHQAGRLLNLELLAVHGPRAHAAAAAHTEAAIHAAERVAVACRDEAAAVNRARKLAHQRAAAAIDAAEDEWAATVAKCGTLEVACAEAEAELERRRPAGWGAPAATGLPSLPDEEDGAVEKAMDE
jgi:pre-mRNA-splicing factor SPF27